jgi:hypothetical protein
LELAELGSCRGETRDRHEPVPSLDAMLIQPEYFPDSSPDLISGNCISDPSGGNDPDSGSCLSFPLQDGQYQVLTGPGFAGRFDQAEF